MAKLADVEGIGPAYAAKLEKAGVASTQALLDKGSTPQGRKAIAAQSGISESLILQWVNHVDLYRIRGVGSEYADLLEAAGVDTVVELAQRRPENLYKALLKVNQEKKLVRRMPSLAQVQDWVSQAEALPRVVQY